GPAGRSRYQPPFRARHSQRPARHSRANGGAEWSGYCRGENFVRASRCLMSDDEIIRSWLRAHNSHGIVTLHRIDDTNPVQSAQIEGYQTEIRDGMQRHQQFGISTVPLPGSKGYATYQSGHRGAATVITVEDPRYRPKNQQPGEVLVYMVDGASSAGTGGTMR